MGLYVEKFFPVPPEPLPARTPTPEGTRDYAPSLRHLRTREAHGPYDGTRPPQNDSRFRMDQPLTIQNIKKT